jgi:hypothetical protein
MTYLASTIDPYETSASDWANGIRDRTINVFSSTADRDSQITAPVAGMTCYIGRQMYVHNGTSWVQLGNIVLDISSRTSDVTATGTEVTTGDKVTFTAVANHRYRIGYADTWQISGAGETLEINMRYAAGSTVTTASTLLRQRGLVSPGANYAVETNWDVPISGLSAASYSVEVFFKRSFGSGTATMRGSASSPAYLYVENMGKV